MERGGECSCVILPRYIFCSQLLSLPDMKVSGIALTGGKLTGLSNLSRWGNADIDIKCEILFWLSTNIFRNIFIFRNDRAVLSFSLSVVDLLATYTWKRKKIKYESMS